MKTISPFTVMFLRTPSQDEVLLLQRAHTKRLFPGLYTGIGGHVDIQSGENDIWSAMRREWEEETKITWDDIEEKELVAQVSRRGEDESVLLFVFSGMMEKEKVPLVCTEGSLHWVKIHEIENMPLIPTSRLILRNFFVKERTKTKDEVYFSVVNKDYSELLAFPQ